MSKIQRTIEEELTEDEIATCQLLEIMKQDKDPEKWHQNLFGNKGCYQSKELVKWSSSSSISTVEENDVETLVDLVAAYREEEVKSPIEGSSLTVPSNILSQEYLLNFPQLEHHLRGYILECGNPLKKKLESSDVKIDQNRIFLPKKQVEEWFIPLLKNDENIEDGIQACVYDVHGNKYNMGFKKWAKKFYVLNNEWKKFIGRHELEKGDSVKVWIFRHSTSNKLCFVLEYEKMER